jgi:DNA-binding response OmpR family regulator
MTRILVVDDEPHIVSLVTRALRAEGYDTVSADDGQAALDAAQGGDIDLVILDVGLPSMDGSRSCARCARRADGCRSSC